MVKIAAIVLAAGDSKRFGQKNKLLANYEGKPLMDHALTLVDPDTFFQRILVTGYEHERIGSHATPSFKTVVNSDCAGGMGKSLACGVKTLAPCDCVMVFLADMPEIKRSTVTALIRIFITFNSDTLIVRPIYEGTPGHPVLFGAAHRKALEGLHGDQGGADIIKANQNHLHILEVRDAGTVHDIDKRVDLNPPTP